MALWGLAFNKMYVRWKVLCSLGAAFWVLLCLYDAYFIDPATKFYYSDSDKYQWLTEVSQEEITSQALPESRTNEINFLDDKYTFGMYLIFSNVITFFITIIVCCFGKMAIAYLWKFRANYRLNVTSVIPTAKLSSSKIPVLLTSKSGTNIQEDAGDILKGDFCKSPTSNDLTSDISSKCQQQMEKQCAKLKHDVIAMQANSLNENAALLRKVDGLTKEKREICGQLLVAQKENRAAKQQLEELLTEKTLLLKRLECAFKVFKYNRKTKKAALSKLEEAQSTIGSLRQQLETTTAEKISLKNKIRILEADYKLLKESLEKYEDIQDLYTLCNTLNAEAKSKPATPKLNDALDDAKKTDFSDSTQSHKDVQIVQMRLINLEKSLDKLKLSSWSKNDEPKAFPRTNFEENNAESEFVNPNLISTKPKYPLEEQNSSKVSKNDNLTDEQRRRKIMDPQQDSSGDKCSSNSKQYDHLMEGFNFDSLFERTERLVNLVKNLQLIKNKYYPNSNDNSASPNEDDETDGSKVPKNRIVSNSPAFQNFVKSMDKEQRKFAIPDNIF